MDDGELEFSNSNMGGELPSCSMDSFFDELLRDSHEIFPTDSSKVISILLPLFDKE